MQITQELTTLYSHFSNRSETLPIEGKRNITGVALSPDGYTLIVITEGQYSNADKSVYLKISDSFAILCLRVLGLTVSHINGSRTLFFVTSPQYHCILGLAERTTLHPRAKL